MQKWIDDGAHLMERDEDAEYAAVIEIDMNKITEPILCAPNDPDDARLLSEVCEGWEAEHMDVSTIKDIFYLRICKPLLSPHFLSFLCNSTHPFSTTKLPSFNSAIFF